MDEWKVFLVLAEVVGLFLLVGVPILKLNSTLVSAIAEIKELRKEQEEHKTNYKEFTKKSDVLHDEFRDHLGRHDLELSDHDHRLRNLENK